jgi:hypothetical protein
MNEAMRVRHELVAYRNLLGLLGNTHAVVDQASVVAEQSVATVLRDDSKGNQESQTIAVAPGPHEVQVTAVLLVSHLQADGFFDFAVLELDSGIVLIAVTVVVSQGVESLIVSLFGNQPTRRLRDPCNTIR